jgi:hypothetical protein
VNSHGAKQCTIPDLSSSSIDRDHHFLGQIFRDRALVAAPPEKRHQLRRENAEEGRERILVRVVQELVGHIILVEPGHLVPTLVCHAFSTFWERVHFIASLVDNLAD